MRHEPRRRTSKRLISSAEVVVLLLCALGLAAFVPAMITRATEGPTPVPIHPGLVAKVRLYESMEGNEWAKWRDAVPCAVAAWCALAVVIQRSIRSPRLRIGLFLHSGALLVYAISHGARVDYWAYLEIWDVTMAGGDPWWIQPGVGTVLNAYGPLFLVFAPMALVHPLLPKVLFCCAFLLMAIRMARAVEQDQAPGGSKLRPWALWGFLLCPLFWNELGYYGRFDVLTGVCLAATIAAVDRGAQARSGLAASLGFLLKFMPVIVMPFLTLDTRGRRLTIRPKLALSFLGFTVAVMGLSWCVWGPAVFRPLVFASSRDSDGLSIWRYLGGPYTPWALAGWPRTDLDEYSRYVLLAALAIVGWLHVRRGAHPVHSALLAMLTTVNLYHVGYPGYHMAPILMMPYWYRRFRESIRSRPKLMAAVGIYLLWITVTDFRGIPGDWACPVSLAIGLNLIANMVRMMGSEDSGEPAGGERYRKSPGDPEPGTTAAAAT